MDLVYFYPASLGLTCQRIVMPLKDIFKSKMQEGMDKFIPKQSADYVTNKPLWMTHRAFKAKNNKYLY